jgi:NAD dependent epimerase/dehydratase family enzyme
MAIEDGARRAAQASPGTALALLRIGHVLSNEGGLLPYLELASLCRASRLGSGGQYVPWVHIHDVASAVARVCAQHDFLAGVVNVAAPEPCTNAQLLRALAKSRGRNLCVVPVPSPALHLALGESACVVLDSQRVVPARLLDAGFAFEFGDLSEALLTLPLKLW